jgi:hypothetical protein
MPTMGTVARSGTVWERGRGGRGKIGPQRPQICPLSDSGRLGGARVAAGVRRALRAAVSVPTPAARGPLAGRRAVGAAPAHDATVQATGGWSPRKAGVEAYGKHVSCHWRRLDPGTKRRFCHVQVNDPA